MNNISSFLAFAALAGILTSISCTSSPRAGMEKSLFGTLPDGQTADLYTLRNEKGMTVKITNFGGTIVSWTAPDKNGNYEDITLGCD